MTNDHVGSPRIVTNELGQVKSRTDFMPYGEELALNVGSRSASLKYGVANGIRQKFTGYEDDVETGLDFAEARMYEKRHGRFTAVDPLLASGKSTDPQTFNRYSYAINNPIAFTDPTGLCTAPSGLKPGQVGVCFEAFIASPRIGPGGIGHGDGRTFNGFNGDLTARVMIQGIISADSAGVSFSGTMTTEPSKVTVEARLMESGIVTGPDGSRYTFDPKVSLSFEANGTATPGVAFSNDQRVAGDQDFGKGIDMTLSISNGTNGFQQAGKDMQSTGGKVGSGLLVGAGAAVEAGAPKGTIDGNISLRVTGSGNVTGISANGRPYPSYAAYSYTTDGKTITTKTHLEQRETPPVENLTKGMQPFQVIR